MYPSFCSVIAAPIYVHDRIAATSMSQLDIRHASVADAARIAPLFDAYRQF